MLDAKVSPNGPITPLCVMSGTEIVATRPEFSARVHWLNETMNRRGNK